MILRAGLAVLILQAALAAGQYRAFYMRSLEPLNRTVANTLLTLGNRMLAVSYSGLAPGLAGVYQVNFQAPADLPAGITRLALLVGGTPSAPVEIEVR